MESSGGESRGWAEFFQPSAKTQAYLSGAACLACTIAIAYKYNQASWSNAPLGFWLGFVGLMATAIFAVYKYNQAEKQEVPLVNTSATA